MAGFHAFWPLIFIFCMNIHGIRGSTHEYKFGKFLEEGNAYVFFGGSEGMFANRSKSYTSGIANGQSYIRFDHSITFHRTSQSASKHDSSDHSSGLVQAVVFDMADRDKLGGSAYGGRISLCCTPDLAQEFGCNQGEVIHRPSADNEGWPRILNVNFEGDKEDVTMPMEKVEIPKTGMYIVYFVFCDPQLEGLTISGQTVWKNPFGYLPGRMAPLLTFYGVMSVAYVVLGLLWLLQYVRFWRDILQLQNCITLVIALGMAEMCTWYFDYVNFNATGRRPVGITFWAVTMGAIRKTVSRMLLLVVSMGYGVVRPTLGGLTSKVLALGGIYFLASESLDVVEHVGRVDELSYRVKLLLVLPVAILDALFILWIFSSLSKTLEKLQSRKQGAKLELYKKFTNGLAVAVIASIAWIGYELYFKASDPYGERWQSSWIISGFWNLLGFILLCVICVLWSPSQNSTRYAYSEEVGEDFDDEESIALTSVANASLSPEKTATKVERERKVNTDVFSLEDDQEEDKRE